MDYTKGALNVGRDEMIDTVLVKLGPPQRGNSQFTTDNFLDLFSDRGYYILRRPMAEELLLRFAKPRPYVPEVCDCDSKTICFGADLIDATRDLGWTRGFGMLGLNYTSKTLGKPHTNRMSGYHQAPLVLTFNEVVGDVELSVVQPPTLWPSGQVTPPLWQPTDDEIRFYVCPQGIT